MENVKRILFPVDLSTVSPKIVPDVLALARKLDAGVDLLFVSTSLEQYASFYTPHPSLDVLESDLQKAAERKLKEFQEQFFSEWSNTRRATRRGDPAEEIVKYAGAENIDLIVIGTHGRKGLDRALFGSVAERVVKSSAVPVMSINPYKRK